ncbi:MAG: flagellar biosynthesis protein FlhA [Candidatus Goldbacteria bacterium]|nr:flagellar biosynthesis protein FlhA [Candidatus Goldiibacteriota bacterium]
MPAASPDTGFSASLRRSTDFIVVFAIVAVVLMIVVPLPPFLLDLLLVLNLALALVVLIVTMYAKEPLQFSTFPTLLLIVTVFRLALNISATRLILSQPLDVGEVIPTFGNFVVGAQDMSGLIIGLVIFTIIILVQFVVITSGAQRVAEVAARFTLDAMPGKQMAIDADLNAGLITDEEARGRRRSIEREADFYGSMDGASKFVRGDAIAAIVIVLINIIAGFFIGIIFHGMTLADAAMRYTVLTIGEGLVTQIPALLLSVGTGIIVTRAASDANLGQDFAGELFAQPRAIALVGVVLFFMGFVFPSWLVKIPFFMMAVIAWTVSYIIGVADKKIAQQTAVTKEKEEQTKREPENVMPLIQVDTMELEIGFALIPLVDPSQGGDLLDRVTILRKQTALELGLVVPPIRIRDNMQLSSNEYVAKIKGVEVSRGKVEIGYYLAMKPGSQAMDIEGIPAKDPAFNLPAKWIKESEKRNAELKGYTVVDVPSVISTHLSEIIKAHADELLTRQEVQQLIDMVRKTNAAVVDELIPGALSVGELQKVLQNLIREKVSIRDLVTVFETLADHAKSTKDTEVLTEFVRQAMARYFTHKYSKDGIIFAITIDSELEQHILESLRQADKYSSAGLDPHVIQGIYNSVINEFKRNAGKEYDPVVLCSPLIRGYFRKIVEKILPNLAVLSYNEVVPKVEVRSVGMVKVPL